MDGWVVAVGWEAHEGGSRGVRGGAERPRLCKKAQSAQEHRKEHRREQRQRASSLHLCKTGPQAPSSARSCPALSLGPPASPPAVACGAGRAGGKVGAAQAAVPGSAGIRAASTPRAPHTPSPARSRLRGHAAGRLFTGVRAQPKQHYVVIVPSGGGAWAGRGRAGQGRGGQELQGGDEGWCSTHTRDGAARTGQCRQIPDRTQQRLANVWPGQAQHSTAQHGAAPGACLAAPAHPPGTSSMRSPTA